MAAQKTEVYDHILAEIVAGRLGPGDVIDEAALLKRFGVSKTPVREAILQLEAAGIVVKRPRAGAAVASLTPEDLIELIELHSELEGAAAFHAARRATPAQLGALEAAADAYASNADPRAAYDLNLAFHLAVFACANNTRLSRQIDATGVRLVSYFRAQERLRQGPAQAAGEHAAIVDAIRAGDSDAARAAMRRHGEVSSDTLLDVLSRMKA